MKLRIPRWPIFRPDLIEDLFETLIEARFPFLLGTMPQGAEVGTGRKKRNEWPGHGREEGTPGHCPPTCFRGLQSGELISFIRLDG